MLILSPDNLQFLLYLLQLGLGGEIRAWSPERENYVPDWPAIFDTALQQEVLPFVFDGYTRLFDAKAKVPEMPVAIKKQMIAVSYHAEVQSSLQHGRAVKMAYLFAENGIRTYVLKGQVISECYPRPEHRLSSDLDCFLLSSRGQDTDVWEKGNALVENAGYRVKRNYYKNSTFRLPDLKVENHYYLTPFRGNRRLEKLELLLQHLLREDKGQDRFAGTELCRPPVLASALFMVEHAYSHFLHEGLSIKHITDWMMFLRAHRDEIDWPRFDLVVDKLGFRRFFDAYRHLGTFFMGGCDESDLTRPEKRMMASIGEGLDLVETDAGVRGKLNLVRNTLRASWKYRLFSPISVLQALWIQAKGVLFDRHPVLDFTKDTGL